MKSVEMRRHSVMMKISAFAVGQARIPIQIYSAAYYPSTLGQLT